MVWLVKQGIRRPGGWHERGVYGPLRGATLRLLIRPNTAQVTAVKCEWTSALLRPADQWTQIRKSGESGAIHSYLGIYIREVQSAIICSALRCSVLLQACRSPVVRQRGGRWVYVCVCPHPLHTNRSDGLQVVFVVCWSPSLSLQLPLCSKPATLSDKMIVRSSWASLNKLGRGGEREGGGGSITALLP